MAEVNKNIDNVKTKKTELLQKTWVVCALALVCTFLWGSASPCIKLGYAFSGFLPGRPGHRYCLRECVLCWRESSRC